MLIKGYIFVLLVPNDLGFSLTFLPYLREFTTVLVSGFHAVGSGFGILCHWNLPSAKKKKKLK